MLATIYTLALVIWGLTNLEVPARFDTEAAVAISYSPLRQIVPGIAVPDDVSPGYSNNNVDVVEFDGRIYMGYRTAPNHFASTDTRMVIVSTENRETWRLETQFGLLESDMREPRFLVFREQLFFYFFRGGSDPLGFEPQSIYVMRRLDDGTWTDPQTIYEPGHVVWRVRAHGDKAYMSVYYGAALYDLTEPTSEVRLLESANGVDWTPVSEEPQYVGPGAEEGEFLFLDDGSLVATVRLEMGGGAVCTASAEDIGQWDCRFTNYKYDSALLFEHEGQPYVIARRSLSGEFGRELKGARSLVRAWQHLRYFGSRKRTALYRFDIGAKSLTPILDFPSRGDTAFAGIVPLDDHNYYVVNYSCEINGPDTSWISGQLGETNLYETVLTFSGN